MLGIESSCDETAAAVVRDGRQILSNIIASQVPVHALYGGVVPEIASRHHLEAITTVLRKALFDARICLDAVEGIAVTCGPGLIGSLLVGLSTAKAMAFALNLPLVGVNHLEGHVAAIQLLDKPPAFPHIALVVSGGHTTIYKVHGMGNFHILGQTRDDAAGEAFDKGAKLLGIGYPGGIEIDRLSRKGNPHSINFPRGMRDGLDFSFSGLKTALLHWLRKKGNPPTSEELNDLAASYQEAIVDVLTEKTFRAATTEGLERIVVCGGVAANKRLRERFFQEAQRRDFLLFFPPPELCTDNAAMIAVVGEHLLRMGRKDAMSLNALSRWPLANPLCS